MQTIGSYACADFAIFLQQADDESVLLVIDAQRGACEEIHRFEVQPGSSEAMSKAKQCFFDLVESAIHRTSRSMMNDGPFLPDGAFEAMSQNK